MPWTKVALKPESVGRCWYDTSHSTKRCFLFSDLFQEEKNERAAAIVGAAFLDTILEHILIAFLIDDEREVPKLLGIERPLAPYGSRTTLAYCLGLIPKTIRDDLRIIGKSEIDALMTCVLPLMMSQFTHGVYHLNGMRYRCACRRRKTPRRLRFFRLDSINW